MFKLIASDDDAELLFSGSEGGLTLDVYKMGGLLNLLKRGLTVSPTLVRLNGKGIELEVTSLDNLESRVKHSVKQRHVDVEGYIKEVDKLRREISSDMNWGYTKELDKSVWYITRRNRLADGVRMWSIECIRFDSDFNNHHKEWSSATSPELSDCFRRLELKAEGHERYLEKCYDNILHHVRNLKARASAPLRRRDDE